MEQVPDRFDLGIVGDGRAATHFSKYLSLLGVPHLKWARKTAAGIPPESVLADASIVLLLIKDSAIDSFVDAHPALLEKPLVHFSGALTSRHAVGMHPLTSFGPTPFSLEEYERIAFIADEEGPSFSSLFPFLKNPSYRIPRERKVLYHALCVLGGNFSVLLWSEFFRGIEGLGIPKSAGDEYLRAVSKSLERNGPAALTGPLARGDWTTIDQHLRALKDSPYRGIYEAFVKAFLQERNPPHERA